MSVVRTFQIGTSQLPGGASVQVRVYPPGENRPTEQFVSMGWIDEAARGSVHPLLEGSTLIYPDTFDECVRGMALHDKLIPKRPVSIIAVRPSSENVVRKYVRKHFCIYCGNHSVPLKRCGRCKKVRYCSKKCQGLDWTLRHKMQCTVPLIDGVDK